MKTTTTHHFAHVRVRHFGVGDPVLTMECDARPHSDFDSANVWLSGGEVSGAPQDVDWLTIREIDPEGRAILYTAAVDLTSFEIRPLYLGVSAAQPDPKDELYHALKFSGWPRDLIGPSSLEDMAAVADDLCEKALGEKAFQGAFFVAAFTVVQEDAEYVAMRYDGLADWPSGLDLIADDPDLLG